MDAGKRLVISPPTLWHASDAEFEDVRKAVESWQGWGDDATLILPADWTFAVVDMDLPVIVEEPS